MSEQNHITRRAALRSAGIGFGGVVAGSKSVTAQESDDTSWRQFGYDAANTGYQQAAIAPSDGVETEWVVETDDRTRSTVIVGSDTAYIGSSDGTLYALDRDSGDERWRFNGAGGIKQTPVLGDGTVYVTERTGFFAVDTADGSIQWSYEIPETGSDTLRTPPTLADGELYVTTSGGDLLVFAARSGSMNEQINLTNSENIECTTPAVVGSRVYTTHANTLYAVDRSTADVVWTSDQRSMGGAPTATESGVYISTGGEGSEVVALTADGDERWSVETNGYSQASPTVTDDRVFIGDTRGHVFAIDSESGDLEWEFTDGDGWILNAAVVTAQRVLVASERGTMYCLDRSSGEEQWRSAVAPKQSEQIEHSPPVIVDDSIFITTVRGAGQDNRDAGAIYRLTSTGSNTTQSSDRGPSLSVGLPVVGVFGGLSAVIASLGAYYYLWNDR